MRHHPGRTSERWIKGALYALAASAVAATSWAGTWGDYEALAFVAAEDQGRPVVLQFVAGDCAVCSAQSKMLAELLSGPEYKRVAGFRVDCDSFKEFCRAWGVDGAPALVLLRRKKLVNRVVSAATREDLLAFLRDAAPSHGRPGPRPSNRVAAPL